MAEVQEAAHAFSTTNVTLTTTNAGVVISAPRIAVPRQSVTALIMGYAQLETGAGTTAVQKAIRRGTATSGTLVGEANNEEIKAAAGSIEQLFHMVSEELAGFADIDYSLVLTQAGATSNGTVRQAAILVLLL